nr:endoglucanase 12 [Ipomoea batatas]
MHSGGHQWGGPLEIIQDSSTSEDFERVSRGNAEWDRASATQQRHYGGAAGPRPDLDETQKGWLLGPPPERKKKKYVDLGCVVCSKKALKYTLWGIVVAFFVLALPTIIAISLPKRHPRPPPPDNYSVALHKALLFFNAQKSGKLPKNNGVPWRRDSGLDDGSKLTDVKGGLIGGYYDAGDNTKFHFPMSFAMTMLSWSVIKYEHKFQAAGEYDHVRTSSAGAPITSSALSTPPPPQSTKFTARLRIVLNPGYPSEENVCRAITMSPLSPCALTCNDFMSSNFTKGVIDVPGMNCGPYFIPTDVLRVSPFLRLVSFPGHVHHRGASTPNNKIKYSCTGGWKMARQPKKPNPNNITGAMVGGPNRFDQFQDSRTSFRLSQSRHLAGNAGLVAALVSLTTTGRSGVDNERNLLQHSRRFTPRPRPHHRRGKP